MLRKTFSGIMQMLLVVGILSSAFNIQPHKNNGTIYIRDDGSVEPPTAPIYRDENVYTFTSNIFGSVIVERNNIVIDGSGYAVIGTGSEKGIHLLDRKNVTIKDVEIKGFLIGILLEKSSMCSLSGNNILLCHDAIMVVSSSNNRISGNNITANDGDGIKIYYSSNNNIIYGNNITANKYDSITLSGSSNNSIYRNNIANGGLGILLVGSSNNSIYHNNFVSNTFQAHTYMDSVNAWNDSYTFGGNYWSHHNPPDEDLDKIGDVPYVVDENNTDGYPLIYPYGFVPKPNICQDGIVNMKDLYIVARAFGTKPGDNGWNPMADVKMDEIINIKDVFKVAKGFGKTV